jgi:DNA polymerase I
MPEMATLLLVDASNSIYRAFFAIPPLRTASGIPTNAALGFTTMLQKVLREEKPELAAIVWDSPTPKRRSAIYPEYKAHRDSMAEDLRSQMPLIRRIVQAYRIASIEHEGEEADDVIATLTRWAMGEGLHVSIVSTDRDLMQLVSSRVTVLDTMRERRFGPAEVEERYGVKPEQMLDYRAITGDSSDNIPGVKGIGEKGAAQLLATFGSLDAALARLPEVKQARQREALERGREAALLSRELSRLDETLPIPIEREALELRAPDAEALAAIFRELEFKNLLAELGAPPAAAMAPSVESTPADVQVIDDADALASFVERARAVERVGLELVLEPDDAMRGEILGIAFALDPVSARFVDLRKIGAEGLERLAPLLQRTSAIWTGHDLKSAAVALARRGLPLGGRLADVCVAAYLVDPEQAVERPETLAKSHLLRDRSSLDDVFGKGAKRVAFSLRPIADVASFFGALAAISLELDAAIVDKLTSEPQRALLADVERPMTQVLARMELAGVRIDERALETLSVEITRDLAQLEEEIYRAADGRFNIGSTKQLQQVLFEKLKLPPSKRTKTGFSTDESVLEELALRFDLPRFVLEHRKLMKLKGTYVDALPRLVNPETGRIHCQFNQTVAATGRLSASNPNLQNIPVRTGLGQRIREAFVPAEDRVLVSADYSQIELRILAHFSEDVALLEAFARGADIHRETAAQVFGIAPEAVTSEQRASMKAVNFGIVYGSSAFGLARTLGIAQSAAAEYIRAYFARYPGVRAFLEVAIAGARERGYVETLDGRRRYLPDLLSRNRVRRAAAERVATNSAIQGTAADLIKRAMVQLDADLARPGAPRARMILQVHDELLFEVAPDDLEAFREHVRTRMQSVAQLRVPLLVEVGSGSSWRSAH